MKRDFNSFYSIHKFRYFALSLSFHFFNVPLLLLGTSMVKTYYGIRACVVIWGFTSLSHWLTVQIIFLFFLQIGWMTTIAETKINSNHPLFVHASDTPRLVLVPVRLTEVENYGLWKWSMCIALQAKRELRFVLGTCKLNSFEKELHEQWQTCNVIIILWIINTISPTLLSGIVYASYAHLVWKYLRERFHKVNHYEFLNCTKKL